MICNTFHCPLFDNDIKCPCQYLSQTAHYAERVDLKGGLLKNSVCKVKFPVVESYISLLLFKVALGHRPDWTWRFGDSHLVLHRTSPVVQSPP